jgi:hypothetical protein
MPRDADNREYARDTGKQGKEPRLWVFERFYHLRAFEVLVLYARLIGLQTAHGEHTLSGRKEARIDRRVREEQPVERRTSE